MRMCTVAITPPFDAHAHRCNESGCCCFNGRETVSLFAIYTSSKGVSMETVESPLDPPLHLIVQIHENGRPSSITVCNFCDIPFVVSSMHCQLVYCLQCIIMSALL